MTDTQEEIRRLQDVLEPVSRHLGGLHAEESEAACIECHRYYLIERLKAAEVVCAIFGWMPVTNSERGKAALQAWMDWSHTYGQPEPSPEWDQLIAELAARRDEIRAQTLAKIEASGEVVEING